jgi:type IV pilus assembly protein PilN
MKISVNLATRPYVELRPFFLRLRIIMGALLVVAIAVALVTHHLQTRLNVAAAQMNRLQQQTAAAQMEKASNERRMRQPQNAAVLARAHFLNNLFLRKSFSWTAVMMDLEQVLPGGVQVTSIEPQIASDGDVTIRLRVSGERDRAILLVRNLERSRRFIAPQLTAEVTAAKDQNARGQVQVGGPPPGVEFEIMARYNPLPEGESYARPKKQAVAENGGASEIPAGTPHHNRRPANSKFPPSGVVLQPFNPAHPRPMRPGGAR